MPGRFRSGYTLRALACLKPYWPIVVAAYAVVFLINGANIWMPIIIGDIVDSGIRPGVRDAIVRGSFRLGSVHSMQSDLYWGTYRISDDPYLQRHW